MVAEIEPIGVILDLQPPFGRSRPIGPGDAIRAGVVPLPSYVLSDGWQRERWHRRDGEVVTGKRIDRYDPDLGWTLFENVRGVTVNGAPVSSNAAGMRGEREYPRERGPGTLRVVAIGDSFTFGQCVADAETFAARLEARIAPGEVLNLAVHGYGHDQMLLALPCLLALPSCLLQVRTGRLLLQDHLGCCWPAQSRGPADQPAAGLVAWRPGSPTVPVAVVEQETQQHNTLIGLQHWGYPMHVMLAAIWPVRRLLLDRWLPYVSKYL